MLMRPNRNPRACRRGFVLLPVVAAAASLLAESPELAVPEMPGCKDLKMRMASFYEPVVTDFTPKAPSTTLPLKLESLTNAQQAQQMAGSDKAKEILSKNAFVVMDYGRQQDLVKFYDSLKRGGTPIFVTSDSLLHLYHIQFDETLKGIEEREFYGDIVQISKALQAESLKLYGKLDGDAKEAARRCLGYVSVGLELLAEDTLRGKVVKARDFVKNWKGERAWQLRHQVTQKYPDVMKALSSGAPKPKGRGGLMVPGTGGPRGPQGPPLNNREQILAALEGYLQKHPGGKVIETEVPAPVAADVAAELKPIHAHAGFGGSALFKYDEDYSQYVPRGHYTRSEELKRYFRAMMWFGRMTFVIKGGNGALVSEEEARVQTLSAALLASMMDSVKLEDGRTVGDAWDRIYSVTSYYVGLADDLTPYEYRGAMRKVFGPRFAAAELGAGSKWFKFRAELAMMRPPEIYSGTGNLAGPPSDLATEADLAKALEKTKGMRLMGQRYIPDSYMMGQLVYPTVGTYSGKGNPFTLVATDGGPVRGFPRGLDVMAVLGSARAREILRELGDDQYARFEETLAKVQDKFSDLSDAEWNRNMYWSWLNALRALLKGYGDGYPSFMRSAAWQDKQLNAALGSWSQLRHDTILYAKQSYTMVTTGMPMRPRMVEGYVEPVPEFYSRVLALTRMTREGLEEMKVLDNQSSQRLKALESIVERLLKLSTQELEGKQLAPGDYAFINSFGKQLKAAVAGVDRDGLETTIIADVHTDANSGRVLEEGTGYLRAMLVAYPMPDGGTVLGMGPVFSYYEFKHPMADRLTDKKWKAMLRGANAPQLPEWIGTFSTSAGQARAVGGPGHMRGGGRIIERLPVERLKPMPDRRLVPDKKLVPKKELRPEQKIELKR